ncbi:MAG TPA: hypothetical protein VLG50_05005 [Candidatus Saccharimonadales bacterium]|nr:hypothetical protein [Candidatus Saccharimonadales bacterium]
MSSSSEELGYYSSGSYEEPEELWEFEESPKMERKFPVDPLSNVINKDIPIVMLNMDIDTLNHFCTVNKRFQYYCNTDEFWYLKLLHDYPGYVTYFKKSTSVLGKMVYQDMVYRSKKYYHVYSHFRQCLEHVNNDDKIEIIRKNYTLLDGIFFLMNNQISDASLKLLFSLSLPYSPNNFERERIEFGYSKSELLSPRFVIKSFLPTVDLNNKNLNNIKNTNLQKWRIIKCVVQTYFDLKLSHVI